MGEKEMRKGLEAAIRAAKLALFVIKKQGVMPNSSWETGFESDLKTAEAALPIKDERVSDRLRRMIHDGYVRNHPLTAICLTYEHARKLAAELAEMQLNYKTSEDDIYASLITGGYRFMDLPITVQP